MDNYIIYKAVSPNNKVYIGLTCNGLEFRKRQHNNNSKYKSGRFQLAIRKYGINSFTWEILENNCSRDEAVILEKYYIKQHDSFNRKNGYNGNEGGLGNTKKHTNKTKEIIRLKHKLNPIFKKCAISLKEFYNKNPNARKLNGIKSMSNSKLKEQATNILNKYREKTHVSIMVDSKIFKTTKAASEYIGCSPQSIRFALKHSKIVKGYSIEVANV